MTKFNESLYTRREGGGGRAETRRGWQKEHGRFLWRHTFVYWRQWERAFQLSSAQFELSVVYREPYADTARLVGQLQRLLTEWQNRDGIPAPERGKHGEEARLVTD